MRELVLLGASALITSGFALSAMAADDPIGGVYGNTLVMTDSKGVTKLWINRDGTFSGASSKGQKYSGRWRLSEDGAKFCTTADLPASAPKETPAPKESCFPFEAGHKIGDTWQQPEGNGEMKTVEIIAGM